MLVEAQFADGERLVTSRLRAPLPGMKVRTAEGAASQPAEAP